MKDNTYPSRLVPLTSPLADLPVPLDCVYMVSDPEVRRACPVWRRETEEANAAFRRWRARRRAGVALDV